MPFRGTGLLGHILCQPVLQRQLMPEWQKKIEIKDVMTGSSNFHTLNFCNMQRKIWILVSMALLAGVACTRDGKKDLRDFYFPLKQLEDGMVYAYESARNDSLRDTTYWYYRSFLSDTAIFLTGTYYGSLPSPQQFVREEMVRNGMLTNEVFLYTTDSLGKQQPVLVEVLSGSAFPFEVSDSGGIFLYKIRFAFPANPEDTITLIKNRRYLGDTTFTFQNKTNKAVVFELKELIESGNRQQGYVEPRYAGKEIYAKGIGLVYSEKRISEGYALANRLIFRCSMDELVAIFQKKYPGMMMGRRE